MSDFKLSQHFIFGNILSWKNRFQQSKAASAAFGTLDGSREAIVEQFPGNISDLASVIEYSIVMTSGQKVGVHDLPEYLKNIQAGPEPEEQCPSLRLFIGLSLRELEKRFIKETLDALAGHRRKTAKILGISERNLRYRLNSEEGA